MQTHVHTYQFIGKRCWLVKKDEQYTLALCNEVTNLATNNKCNQNLWVSFKKVKINSSIIIFILRLVGKQTLISSLLTKRRFLVIKFNLQLLLIGQPHDSVPLETIAACNLH